MANAWAFSDFWAGSALIAKLFAIGFEVSAALLEIAVVTVIRLISGAVAGSAGSQDHNQRNRSLGSPQITPQPNRKIGPGAIGDWGFAMSCVLGAIGSIQPAA